MRVTGGLLKGRTIDFPAGKMAIRPAMDKMRESVFSILKPSITGASFLDLFSGSGTIAIEAVSHGACDVELCEMDKAKAKTIFKNVAMTEDELGIKINCHFMAVELYLKRCQRQFDFIFMDPPFPYRHRRELVQTVGERKLLTEGGTLLIHYPREDLLEDTIGLMHRVDRRNYGRSVVDFFEVLPQSEKELDKSPQNDNI
ncbi:MAG TPA: 16S rRNA (guanine(966)-N(2))-methyltransferase RsmD [Treponema sp.]|nr:16S rRNA (guanine(966)-N(2))-methyltransferase RsmD [Treponema sp.]